MHISKIEQRTISGGGDTGYESSIRDLCTPFGLDSLLVHEETLQPGQRGSRPHYHTHKEELIIVLEGRLRVTRGEGFEELSPGSVLGFPPGPANRHFVTNIGKGEAKYISIGTAEPDDETVYD